MGGQALSSRIPVKARDWFPAIAVSVICRGSKCYNNTNRPEVRGRRWRLCSRCLVAISNGAVGVTSLTHSLSVSQWKPPAIAGYQRNSFLSFLRLASCEQLFPADVCLTG